MKEGRKIDNLNSFSSLLHVLRGVILLTKLIVIFILHALHVLHVLQGANSFSGFPGQAGELLYFYKMVDRRI